MYTINYPDCGKTITSSKIFFCSDHHFGDYRMRIMRRPFCSYKEAIEQQIYNHNKIVGKDDIVYHLGDIAYMETPDCIKYAERLNGIRHLFLGNHDMAEISEYYKYFESVNIKLDIDITGESDDHAELHLNHYPSNAVMDRFNLVGHIHDAWKVQRNMINVCGDVWNFKPVPVEEIFNLMRAIGVFYDDDVFAGELECNINHTARGMSGTRATIENVKNQERNLIDYKNNNCCSC